MNFNSKLYCGKDIKYSNDSYISCNNQAPKYAIAQINIPIEILSNGEWINHNDRITIEMFRISSLPPISNIENKELLESIEEILSNNLKENEKTIEEEEIPCKISLKSLNDEEIPCFFIKEEKAIKEDLSFNTYIDNITNIVDTDTDTDIKKSSTISNNIEPESINETTPIYYVSHEELLNRKQNIKRKNSSFKNIIAKINNKTRSNRWNITKDIKDAEY